MVAAAADEHLNWVVTALTRSGIALHKSGGAECGARAQNQATKLFRFFREDDGYNETFAVAKW